tara:strand:+ start:147 stop:401 length:255 start_codon:yes stop_codon:yes gene_type:complete
MENIFTYVLNYDINYHILFLSHKIQLNEVFNEFFNKIENLNLLNEIVEEYNETHSFITLKQGRLIATIKYSVEGNNTGFIVYLS